MSYPNDKARIATEEAVARLAAELDAGKSDALKAYLSAMGRFRRYSWGNVLLISSQRPTATHVAGLHTWNDLGRSVKKNEKGIMIMAPIVVKEVQSSGNVRQPEPTENPRLMGFRTAYVFDVSQTEGKPLPEFAKTSGNPGEYTEKLKGIAAHRGIAVEYDASIAPAIGVSTGGRIRLQPNLEKGEEFSVLVHELAHEMLHHKKDGDDLPKVVREAEAEAVAFVVSRSIGLETNTAAADYIALYNGDKKTLMDSLAAIQQTSAKILEDLLPEDRSRPSTPNLESKATAESSVATRDEPLSLDR